MNHDYSKSYSHVREDRVNRPIGWTTVSVKSDSEETPSVRIWVLATDPVPEELEDGSEACDVVRRRVYGLADYRAEPQCSCGNHDTTILGVYSTREEIVAWVIIALFACASLLLATVIAMYIL
jgi:hypothetical protein